jgi:hypothetical protein
MMTAGFRASRRLLGWQTARRPSKLAKRISDGCGWRETRRTDGTFDLPSRVAQPRSARPDRGTAKG